MNIQYEEGDRVFQRPYHGGESYEVIAVRQKGVTVKNRFGETFFLGKHQVEPTPGTLAKAWVKRPEQ